MAEFGDLNYTTAQINEAIEKALSGGGGGSASIPVVNLEGEELPHYGYEILPNTYYILGLRDVVPIILAQEIEGILNVYQFEFYCGEYITYLLLPQELRWENDEYPIIEPYTKYRMTIINGIVSVLKISALVATITVYGSPMSGGLVYVRLNEVDIYTPLNMDTITPYNPVGYKIGDIISIHGSIVDSITLIIRTITGEMETIFAGNIENSLTITKPISTIEISITNEV